MRDVRRNLQLSLLKSSLSLPPLKLQRIVDTLLDDDVGPRFTTPGHGRDRAVARRIPVQLEVLANC